MVCFLSKNNLKNPMKAFLFFMVLAVSLSTITYAVGLNVNKYPITPPNYPLGFTIEFVINLTNTENSNITSINVTDAYNDSCVMCNLQRV